MSLFTMGKKTQTLKPPSVSSADLSSEDPVEPERPGTSGTEILLTTNRRTANAQYAAAQRAEQAYKAKKRSAGARQHRSAAAEHFGKAGSHFKEGIKSFVRMVVAVPWMLRGWREEREIRNEKKSVERFEKQKLKLEEELAKRGAAKEKDVEKGAETPAA
jgi:hypothetical protein